MKIKVKIFYGTVLGIWSMEIYAITDVTQM